MEHHAQSIDDALISGLSYKMKAGASYVTNRRSVSYFSSGGNSYSSSGVRVLKFNLTGDQWLDPSTLRVAFTLNNDTTAVENKLIQPLSWNPAIFFRRARVIAGGQILEDIDDFNRLSMMLTCLKPRDEQLMIASEGFGSFDDKGPGVTEAGGGVQDDRKNYRTDDYDIGGYVEPAGSRRVLFKPMFGLLHQEKLLPLRYCPIQIELELVNQGADAVHVGTSLNGQTSDSDKWSMSDAQIKCDLVTLDNSLENEYASHLLSGKSLPINFSTWNHTNQSTGNDKNFSAHINRALTRLKSVFITLAQTDKAYYKTANDFFHPISQSTTINRGFRDDHSYWVQIGSKNMPEYPVNSVSESLYQLRKTVGQPFFMHERWYRHNKYIIGLDMEKVSGAGFTGISTKAGDLMTLNFRDCDIDGFVSIPSRVFCALNYDVVLNIKDSGVELMD